MPSLRQQMIADMQLRGLSETTQTAYVRAVRQLAEQYGKSPERISEEELRQYLLYLRHDKQVACSTFTVALYGIKFLYRYTLKRAWQTLELARAPQKKKLPVVLSTAEVRRVLQRVRRPHYRACLSTIYSCGLRVCERVHLQVRDIDSDRMMPPSRCLRGVCAAPFTLHCKSAGFRNQLPYTPSAIPIPVLAENAHPPQISVQSPRFLLQSWPPNPALSKSARNVPRMPMDESSSQHRGMTIGAMRINAPLPADLGPQQYHGTPALMRGYFSPPRKALTTPM